MTPEVSELLSDVVVGVGVAEDGGTGVIAGIVAFADVVPPLCGGANL